MRHLCIPGGLILVLLNASVMVSVWSWRTWGAPRTWIMFAPVIALLSLYLSDQIVRILPNLT